MKCTFACVGRIGAGALMMGIAFAVPTVATAEPVQPPTPQDSFNACRADGSSFQKCCAAVGGSYIEVQTVVPPNKIITVRSCEMGATRVEETVTPTKPAPVPQAPSAPRSPDTVPAKPGAPISQVPPAIG